MKKKSKGVGGGTNPSVRDFFKTIITKKEKAFHNVIY